jgi:hypothetical protein
MAWFCLSEALDFQKNSVGISCFDAQQSSGQITLIRPQMDQRALSLMVHFTVQASQFGQPFAIFPNFHYTRRSECHQFAFQFLPIIWCGMQASTARRLIGSSRFYSPGLTAERGR